VKREQTFSIGTRALGAGQPCFVLAEVASAHGGSADVALKMLDAAFKMGADGIKFQLFKADALAVRRHPSRKDFDQIELTSKEWKKVLKAAKGSGLQLFAECFDRPSLELAKDAGVEAYKVHTTDMENPEFIKAIGAVKKPVLFATGGVPEEAVRQAMDLVDAPAALLHGFQTFPTPIEEIRFRDLQSWKERYQVPVGFLDHTDGGSAFALVAPALAVGYGADLVEKHFTLDRSQKGFDYQSSLNPEDFYRMVELLRQAERAAADDDAAAADSEAAHRYHRMMARSIVAAGLISRGQVLTAEKLSFKRTDPKHEPGFAPREAHRVIGRRAKHPIQADETIREEMLE
jgi:N,N'-diacetyllegionaminate synthase